MELAEGAALHPAELPRRRPLERCYHSFKHREEALEAQRMSADSSLQDRRREQIGGDGSASCITSSGGAEGLGNYRQIIPRKKKTRSPGESSLG